MKCKNLSTQSFNPVAIAAALLVFIVVVLMAPAAKALTVTVHEGSTDAPINANFRWLIQEDQTYHVPLDAEGNVVLVDSNLEPPVDDGVLEPKLDPNWRVGDPLRNTVSVSFHRSHMPIVAKGTSAAALPPVCTGVPSEPVLPCLDPAKNYYISVLPDLGYSIGGAQINAGQTDVTVYVNKHEIPTARITVFVHQDTAPINNVWDFGELGLEGFQIILEDAGGKYGISAGIQSQDAFGNPLCTSYNPDGSVDVMGSGCVTDKDGMVTIANLAPGKYGVMTVPPNAVETPPGSGKYVSDHWIQTSTIEGKKLIDAWVKANEPAFFGEFGPPGPHVSIGYVPAGPNNPYIDDTVINAADGVATISGSVVNLHLSRPPATAFHAGGPFPHTTPWVGLNLGAAGLGKGVYAARANDDGTFSIPDVPQGDYQLVVWDDNLDLLFAKATVSVDALGNCNALTGCELGDVPVFQWFARMEHYVFNDENENGFWDPDELPMIEQNVNLRWRDGTVYQAFPTDATGVAPFDEVFPFFSWLVAEVDFGRFKATGATVVVDDGGAIPFGDPWAFDDNLNPQVQNNPPDPDSSLFTDGVTRTELGPVLTEAFQAFLGQTNVVQWGKKAYGPGENGGISGMVLYAVTRAEDDPELAAVEPWEPGIPRVTVNLYDSTGTTLLATTETDSWDDSLPTNCQFGANADSGTDDPFVFRGVDTDCYDGMRVWNQVRPGVFDGGYAFAECELLDGVCVAPGTLDAVMGPIPAGQYVAEVDIPAGYEVIKSQDRNVDFGDIFFPAPALLPPPCAGADYVVPAELSLFPGEPAPFAGQTLPLCDRKLVTLSDGANAAADFLLFTEVPIAGQLIGFILDDTANEFDATSPQFGEKYAPPFLPVSIRDWTGREIGRTVSDEFGVYNAMVPSTFTENLGQPSGISPNMLTTCMNAKTRVDGTADPLHNPQYSQFCYTFQYMPGSTTYLDTPVVPVAAFAGADQNPLDCEYVDATPRIYSVDVGTGGGPYIPTTGGGNNKTVDGNQIITITSIGTVEVPNPAYNPIIGGEPKTIPRDYGFGGTPGTVTLGDIPLTNVIWSIDGSTITATVAGGTPVSEVGGRQLTVTRANDASSITGVTVQVGLRQGSKVVTVGLTGDFASIQDAINDNKTSGNDLILVAPGTYNEMVIMWKPVQLQGWGEGSVTIDAIKTPFEKLAAWRTLAESLLDGGVISLAPGQELGFGGIEPATFFSEEGAGVFVVAKAPGDNCAGNNAFCKSSNQGARIDGMTITGADTGGGVVVNGYAHYLDISNLRVINNSAFFAGGVRVGHPMLTTEVTVGQGNDKTNKIIYSDADNDNVRVHHNTITQNGGLDGAGGGLAMHTGSDNYQVTDNFICGNFTNADGAGFAHYGLSNDGLVQGNTVLFNENFNQGISVNGGGILVSGQPPLGCPLGPDNLPVDPNCPNNPDFALSPGSGSVQVIGNLVQGNSAGAGDGAGIRLSRNNGQDAVNGGGYTIDVINNIIVDNVAALSGGGISLQDALNVNILHNTIANNDNASVAGAAFTPGLPTESNPQPGAGIVSRAHSPELSGFIGNGFSDANLVDNIIWQNRMFFWITDASVTPPVSGLCPDLGGVFTVLPGGCGTTEVYDDLAVLGIAGSLDPRFSVLTDTTDYHMSNISGDPQFLAEYVNGNRNTSVNNPEVKSGIQAPPAFDEGGNFIRLRYGPLTQTLNDGITLRGDYHIQTGSSALDTGTDAGVDNDFDGESRPNPLDGAFDIGADEFYAPVAP